MALISFQKVCKAFGAKQILVNVDIEILEGETLTIIGGSGTGKSVFLKLLLGVLNPDKGAVFFRGKNVSDMKEKDLIEMRSHMGMLFQGAALFDSLTVGQNVAYPLKVHFDYDDDKVENIVAECLQMVGLPGIEDMMPADLSGGMRKRIGLARAIATHPDVILYDEPMTGLDPANTQRIAKLIRELQQKLSVTSVVVTHDMEFAFSISNRMAMLHQRKFSFVGTVDEARSSLNPVVQNFLQGKMETGDTS